MREHTELTTMNPSASEIFGVWRHWGLLPSPGSALGSALVTINLLLSRINKVDCLTKMTVGRVCV